MRPYSAKNGGITSAHNNINRRLNQAKWAILRIYTVRGDYVEKNWTNELHPVEECKLLHYGG